MFDIFGPPNIDKLKDKRDAKNLVKALAHRNSDIRRAAALALGELRDASTVEQLIHSLNDENCYVRLAAAEALGNIGDPRGKATGKN